MKLIKANQIHYINQSNCKKNIFNMFNNRGYLLIDEISSNLWPLTRYMYLYKKN